MTELDEEVMTVLNSAYDIFSAEALTLGSSAPAGARGHIRVHNDGPEDEEFVESVSSAIEADFDGMFDFRVDELEAGVVDVWMFAEE